MRNFFFLEDARPGGPPHDVGAVPVLGEAGARWNGLCLDLLGDGEGMRASRAPPGWTKGLEASGPAARALRGARARAGGDQRPSSAHSFFFSPPQPDTPPSSPMATMEAAAAAATVAATTTEVAHPMDEQAGPFPIEKLQVSAANGGGGRGERRSPRMRGGSPRPARCACTPVPAPPYPPCCERGQSMAGPRGVSRRPVQGRRGALGRPQKHNVVCRAPISQNAGVGRAPTFTRPRTRALVPVPTRLGSRIDLLNLGGAAWARRGRAGPRRKAPRLSFSFFCFGSRATPRRARRVCSPALFSNPTFSLTLPPRPPSFLLPTPSLPGTGHRRGRHQEAQGGRHQHG